MYSMRSALTLLFLIVAYNFLLWYITYRGISPVQLFPQDPYHTILVLSFSSTLYVSWLFGERQGAVQWLGFLFFLQIIAMSLYFGDLAVIVKDLAPVTFTLALVALFESPTERRIKNTERERERLLEEIERVHLQREVVERKLRELTRRIVELEREKEEEDIKEERLKQMEEELEALKSQLNDYREKERRLLETNRRLFQLLENIRAEEGESPSRKELTSLRRERKKLIKEVLHFQELLELMSEENEALKDENRRLKEKLEKLRKKVSLLEMQSRGDMELRRRKIIREILESLTGLRFEDKAVEEFIKLPPDKKRNLIKELLRNPQEKIRPLATDANLYKLRFSGGRAYLRREGNGLKLVGILDSEEDKDKNLYIRKLGS